MNGIHEVTGSTPVWSTISLPFARAGARPGSVFRGFVILLSTLSLFPALLVAGSAAVQDRPAVPAATVAEALQKGEAALAAGRFFTALEVFTQAHELAKKSSVAALWGLARANHGIGEFKDEIGNCADGLKLAAGDKGMEANFRQARGVALYLLAQNNADRKLKHAESEFRTVLTLPQPGPLSDFYLGMTILRLGGRNEEGLRHLQTAVDRGLPKTQLDLAKRSIEDPRRAGEAFAPAFQVTTRDGSRISSADLAGKTVLLDFWGTWCAPCRKTTPGLVKLQAKFAESNLVMIGISSDDEKDKETWAKYIDEHQMNWVQSLDLDGTAIMPFFVDTYPTFIVIDPNGLIRLRFSGYGSGAIQRLEKAIAASLGRQVPGDPD